MQNEKSETRNITFLTVIYRTGVNKTTGETFRKATVKGAFINTAAVNHNVIIDNEARYVVRGADKELADHKRDGKYRLYFHEGDCWIDERPDKIDKHIIRVRGVIKIEWRGELSPRLANKPAAESPEEDDDGPMDNCVLG